MGLSPLKQEVAAVLLWYAIVDYLFGRPILWSGQTLREMSEVAGNLAPYFLWLVCRDRTGD